MHPLFLTHPQGYYTIDRRTGKRLNPFNLKILALFHIALGFTNREQRAKNYGYGYDLEDFVV
jgi:hypothetical protein